MAIKLLSDLVTVVSEHISNPSTSGFEIFVGLEHYDAGEPVITRFGSTANLESSVKHFIEGDILVARRNVYLKRAGVVKFEGVTSGDSIVLRVKDECYKDIIPFILNTEEFWDYAEQNSDGTMSKRLAPDVLLEYECDIPDNHKDIAKKLWAAYELKEAYKKMIAATDEMVKSQFIEMFSGVFPCELWENCLTITNGKKYPEEYSDTGVYPVCGSGGTMGYGNHKLCSKETTILGRKGNINSPIYMDTEYWIVDTAFSLDVDREKLHPTYFFYWCTLFDFTKYNKQGVLPSLTKNDLLKIEMPIPPKDKQIKFVAIVEQADKSKFELQQAIDKIDKVMKSLLQ